MATQGEPRYTIEQIELLRRLMRTGLTKQEIIHALDTMTKLDAELSPSQGPPPPVQQHQQTHPTLHHIQQQQIKPPSTTQQQILVNQTPQHQQQQHVTQTIYVTSPSATPAVDQLMSAVHQAVGNGKQQQQQKVLHPTMLRIANVQEGYEHEEVKCGFESFDVADEEVNDLLRRSPHDVKEEIKEFLTKHRITQNQISHATGISQSYISQYILHGSIMRHSTQALFYRWYIGKMKEMDALEKEDACFSLRPKMKHEYPGKNMHLFPPVRRRDRFLWNEACLKVLESYWKKNPYPNDIEREKITEACNVAQQAHTPENFIEIHKLVTTAKVYNWFANRRKDANRKRRSTTGENNNTENNNTTEAAVVTFNEGDPDASPSEMLQIHEGSSDISINDDASQETTTTITFQESVPQETHSQLELDQVNNSIITLIEAVEEKDQEEKS